MSRRTRLCCCQAAWLTLVMAPVAAFGQDAGGASVRTPEGMVEDAIKMIKTGDPEQLREAANLVQRARILRPNMDKINLAAGLLALESKRPLEAIQRLEEYNRSDEGRKDYLGFAAVGNIYKDSLMNRQAVPALELAKALAPEQEDGKPLRAEIAIDLAMVYYKLERKDKAMETAKEAQRLAPNDPKIQFRLAQLSASTEDYTGAETAVRRSIELCRAELQTSPFQEARYNLLLNCYQMVVNLRRREISANPDDGLAYFKLATTLREQAELYQRVNLLAAREAAVQALTREPGNHAWLLFVARAEAELGGLDEARDRVEKVLKSDPENREAIELRDALIAARSKATTQ